MAERDRRSAELRSQLENDAAILRRAQKAVDAERAAQKVCKGRYWTPAQSHRLPLLVVHVSSCMSQGDPCLLALTWPIVSSGIIIAPSDVFGDLDCAFAATYV